MAAMDRALIAMILRSSSHGCHELEVRAPTSELELKIWWVDRPLPRHSGSSAYGHKTRNLGDHGSELEASNKKRLSLCEGQLGVLQLKMSFGSEKEELH